MRSEGKKSLGDVLFDVFNDVKNTSFYSTAGPNFVVNIQPRTAIRRSVAAPAFLVGRFAKSLVSGLVCVFTNSKVGISRG